MTTELEQSVIDCARLVHLGWLGDGVDGGAAMRVALKKLGAAFHDLDTSEGERARPRSTVQPRCSVMLWVRQSRNAAQARMYERGRN